MITIELRAEYRGSLAGRIGRVDLGAAMESISQDGAPMRKGAQQSNKRTFILIAALAVITAAAAGASMYLISGIRSDVSTLKSLANMSDMADAASDVAASSIDKSAALSLVVVVGFGALLLLCVYLYASMRFAIASAGSEAIASPLGEAGSYPQMWQEFDGNEQPSQGAYEGGEPLAGGVYEGGGAYEGGGQPAAAVLAGADLSGGGIYGHGEPLAGGIYDGEGSLAGRIYAGEGSLAGGIYDGEGSLAGGIYEGDGSLADGTYEGIGQPAGAALAGADLSGGGIYESGEPLADGIYESGEPLADGIYESGEPLASGINENGEPLAQGGFDGGEPLAQGGAYDVGDIAVLDELDALQRCIAEIIDTLSDSGEALMAAADEHERLSCAAMELRQASQLAVLSDAIQGVSFQLNLTSLKAATEAAFAGEAGRGFTAVAEEIREISYVAHRTSTQISAVAAILAQSAEDLAIFIGGASAPSAGYGADGFVRAAAAARAAQATVERLSRR